MLADLPLMTYEFLVTGLPLLAVLTVYGRRQKKQGFPIASASYFKLLVLGAYLMGVLHVTGAGTLWAGLRHGLRFENVNLLPFSQPGSLVQCLLNILMLMPLGYLIPLIYSRQNHAFRILILGAGISLLVEVSQLLSYRAVDVDDLILNTLGALLGYGLYRLTARLSRSGKLPRRLPSSGLLLVPATVFLARFLLYDELGFLHLIYD